MLSLLLQARTLGPWSSAVELVNARQAAIDERNSKLQQQAEQQGKTTGTHTCTLHLSVVTPVTVQGCVLGRPDGAPNSFMALPRASTEHQAPQRLSPALHVKYACTYRCMQTHMLFCSWCCCWFALPLSCAEEDVPWEPSRNPALGPRPSAAVPSLFSLAVTLLVKHIAAVSSLWGVPDSIRSQLAAAVSAQRKLTSDVALLFGQDTPTELVIPDCSQLDAKAMRSLLHLLLEGVVSSEDGSPSPAAAAADGSRAVGAAAGAARLERLELGSCGRGFDDKSAAVVAAAGPLSALRVLRLGGAYR